MKFLVQITTKKKYELFASAVVSFIGSVFARSQFWSQRNMMKWPDDGVDGYQIDIID